MYGKLKKKNSSATFLPSIFVKNSILEKGICHRIPIQTLQFLTALPTRQDDVENRDEAYSEYAST